ncbi:MAG: DEAD/DEAH box helicase family protein [Spirochaetales bacterium]|nr:DEAD/DEAH box helicase family protein [Spirochaetales bacterium]
MEQLTKEYIRERIADSKVIHTRGENIYHLGNYSVNSFDAKKGLFSYTVDGNYGNYTVDVSLENGVRTSCDCPYPAGGCKHIVAVCLDIAERLLSENYYDSETDETFQETDYLGYEEIRDDVIASRRKSAKMEEMEIIFGETCKGEHTIITKNKRKYILRVHDPETERGTCSCPDFTHNRLGLCKHLIRFFDKCKKDRGFFEQGKKETMPFIHIYWDSYNQKPCYFYDGRIEKSVKEDLSLYFSENGLYKKNDVAELYLLLLKLAGKKNVRVDDFVTRKVENYLFLNEMFSVKKNYSFDYSRIKTVLYPYQKKGVEFSLFKTRVIIADEMGLGKTLQAITISILKKDVFGFKRVLVVCPASLKEQWKKEIERFTDEKAVIVAGSRRERQKIYDTSPEYFLITNYEAVLRDIMVIQRIRTDLVILDEAQRIKNFETKTHQAILTIPRKQSIVITGTPLENKLEDLYSILQFSDPELLSPFWIFAANHLKILRDRRKSIAGYKNLDIIHKKLENLVIRRKKEEVLECLPEEITNTYYIDLTKEQYEIHQGYVQSLMPILGKKILTPFDIRTIQQLLLCMRMVCDSTYLIDRKTNLSPKLTELEKILCELVIENKRKTVIFSEWTTMTYLIGKLLSGLKIPFIDFNGKVPQQKRQKLIDEFTDNPSCMVFLSSDAGGVGLNLQAADCVINFELPWNPAKLNQRTGRVNRIGQRSRCINIINLVAKNSIEERVAAGIAMKQELFDAVIDGGGDEVDYSQEKKAEFINRIRSMLDEEQLAVPAKKHISEELPDSTPYYLNPRVLAQQNELDFEKEEAAEEEKISDAAEENIDSHESVPDAAIMEEVLENGLKFLSGLTMMATGKPVIADDESKMVHVDKNTGEVTLKFKLQGFS